MFRFYFELLYTAQTNSEHPFLCLELDNNAQRHPQTILEWYAYYEFMRHVFCLLAFGLGDLLWLYALCLRYLLLYFFENILSIFMFLQLICTSFTSTNLSILACHIFTFNKAIWNNKILWCIHETICSTVITNRTVLYLSIKTFELPTLSESVRWEKISFTSQNFWP